MPFNSRKASQWLPLVRLIDIACIFFGLVVAVYLRGLEFNLSYLAVLGVALFTYLYVAEALNLYTSANRMANLARLARISAAFCIAYIAVVTALFFFKASEEFSRLALTIWFLMSLFALNLWRFIHNRVLMALRRAGYFQRRAAIYGLTDAGLQIEDEIINNDALGIQFIGFYDDRAPERFTELHAAQLLGDAEQLLADAERGDIDVLYLAIPFVADVRIKQIMQRLGNSTLDIHLVFDHELLDLMHGTVTDFGPVTTVSVFDTPYSGSMAIIKRTEDIVLSIAFILASALPMLVIYLAVKLTSPGPGIFKQRRYGMNGEPIEVWKFRSMTTQDNGSKVAQATKNDPRITPVGRFIRKTSLDELPQFFNVLTGQMSIVGPRPHAVAHNELYRQQIPYYMIRHKVKPGITGWAQVNGWRGETDQLYKMERRIEHDLYYMRHWSLFLDLKIVFLTFFKGFIGKNTY
ncbi:undecaprenyl-phosphate glucose phosphotransferase [Salinibius halmophilus]|uniref:undecaprenyl-phosphate glucose phosphotransferase n=1 Tax=Salinibius halmophilus TaxID=1853216 RepID=UPI000E66B191|nr:undecaprenyl-phosphate glucose phosphotransferase [Salinibius halmophilus]